MRAGGRGCQDEGGGGVRTGVGLQLAEVRGEPESGDRQVEETRELMEGRGLSGLWD